MAVSTHLLLTKYAETIAEEVNVQEVVVLGDDVQVSINYIPSGQALGPVFGKDTARIIAAAKAGNASLSADETLIVSEWDQTWTLTREMYELRYSGLAEDHQTVEGGVIVSLDLTITPALKKAGIAREISRHLNQMRKDADLQIDEKIVCRWTSESSDIAEIMSWFAEFLMQEALLVSIQQWSTLHDDRYIAESVCETDVWVIALWLVHI